VEEDDRHGADKFGRRRAAHGRKVGRGKGPMMAVSNLDDFQALDPFFRIIEEGVAGLVDGEHFFDLLAEDVVFEYIITVPGYPRRVVGRQAVAELYRPYGAMIVLDRCYDLAVHNDQVTGVVVLEYASQGPGHPDRGCVQQPLHLGAIDSRPQGRPLTRLPRSARGL